MRGERFAAPSLLPAKMSLRAEKTEVSLVTSRRMGSDAPSTTDPVEMRSLAPAGQQGALRAGSELPPTQPPTAGRPVHQRHREAPTCHSDSLGSSSRNYLGLCTS